MNKRSKGMSEVSKVVFVAFIQHYIQNNVTHVRGVEGGVFSLFSCIQSNVIYVSKVNSFICYVLHCMNKRSKGMSKVSKETQNTQ